VHFLLRDCFGFRSIIINSTGAGCPSYLVHRDFFYRLWHCFWCAQQPIVIVVLALHVLLQWGRVFSFFFVTFVSISISNVFWKKIDSSTVKAAGGFEELFFGVAEEDSATTGMTLKLFFVCGVEEVLCQVFLDLILVIIKQG
jgi:hypothetical protein